MRTYRHRQQPRLIMHQLKILIRKRLRAIDTRAARPIPIQEITPLDHKLLDHAVEFRALVTLGSA